MGTCSPRLGRSQKEGGKGVCVCVWSRPGGGGGTSTPNAKTIKGTHSYLLILTFLVNLGGRVISDRERFRFVPLEKVSNSFCGKVVKNQSKTTTEFAPEYWGSGQDEITGNFNLPRCQGSVTSFCSVLAFRSLEAFSVLVGHAAGRMHTGWRSRGC